MPYEEHHFAEHRENPSAQSLWDTDVHPSLWKLEPLVSLDSTKSMSELFVEGFDLRPARRQSMRRWCEVETDRCLERHGLRVDDGGRTNLMRAIAGAMQRASLRLRRLADGEEDPSASRISPTPDLPAPSLLVPTQPAARALPFAALVEEWAAERRPKEKTRYTFTASLRQFERFVGHDDASRVTAGDLVRWKLALIEAGLNTKTIRDSKLAPVKAIFETAVRNLRLPTNPVRGILVSHKDEGDAGDPDYTDDEARVILRAANAQRDPLLRWAPWICAYTGARISEVCQLRVEDIGVEDGIPFIRFTKAAGSLKNRSSERIIPLHPALVKAGLPDFVSRVVSGPIFAGVKPDRFGSRGGNAQKLIGRWIHSLFTGGIAKQPNHAWRHRMVTLTREYDLRTDISHALTGHSQETTQGDYGRLKLLKAMHNQILKIPELDL
ncbi:site-specific integrase [Methylobacterium sp. P31]